ncbi:MAG: transglycosylase family protein [Nocardioidaceae bacterium]
MPRLAAASVTTAAAVAVPMFGAAAPASAADDGTWNNLAQCESGGDWHINTGNGYYGGVQFSDQTWDAYGGGKYASHADQASRSQQIAIAEKVLDQQGWGAWPACSSELGLGQGDAAGKPSAPSGGGSESHHAGGSHGGSNAQSGGRSASSGSSHGTYTVKPGDTLSKIAQRKGIDGGWHALYDANRDSVDNPTMIYVGEHLQLP